MSYKCSDKCAGKKLFTFLVKRKYETLFSRLKLFKFRTTGFF